MNQVWKFKITPENMSRIEMPEFAIVLHVAEQNGELCLWAEVDIENNPVERMFEVFGTGHNIDSQIGTYRSYLGTSMMCDGDLVWHVYERLS